MQQASATLEADTATFYASLAPFAQFDNALDPATFRPLPDDWVLGVGDIANSTQAIADGRYKAVNLAGAGIIAAVANVLGQLEFPFVFGGDGASFAVPAHAEAAARTAMAATAAWARDELGFDMRVAVVPVAAIRADGQDVRVARFGASRHVSYAMFAGGGLAWAEARMKEGAFLVQAGPAGSRPDLTGLSCRWSQLPAQHGVILSIIVARGPAGDEAGFREAAQHVLSLVADGGRDGRPVSAEQLHYRWSPVNLDEARTKPERNFLWKAAHLIATTLYAAVFVNFRISAGGFQARRYLQETEENSDFRKVDDALRMTIDCTAELADQIEHFLDAAAERFGVMSGVHRQDAAQITCIVPSVTRSDHIHFVDGAGGGYAEAARNLKASIIEPSGRD